MKHTRVSLLALSALAGGVFVASGAATPDMGTNYTLNAIVTTNPMPVVLEVYGLPSDSTTALNEGNYTDFDTDGSGKIDGIVDLIITNLTSDLAPYTEALFIGTASGNVTSSGNPSVPKVKLTIKGNGYAQNTIATTQAQASVNFSFSGSGSSLMTSGTTNFGTNISIVYLNPDGSTNYNSTFYPSYDERYEPLLNDLVFIYNYSDIYTNTAGGTNTINQANDVEFFTDDWLYGTPVSTDTNITGSVTIGTNTYTTYPLGFRIQWSPGGGWTTNWLDFGLSSADVAGFTANYISVNNSVDTNNANETITTTYTSVVMPSSGYSYTNDDRALTNSWTEMDGTITGTIKVGKVSHKISGEAASLFEGHTVYSLGFGSVTNNGTNITATVYVKAVQYNNSMNGQTIYGFDDEIAMVNTKLYVNNDWQLAGTGTGSVNTKKQTFSINEKGLSWSKGSSLKYTGTTVSNLLAGFTALTNITSIVNVAATPSVSTSVTNSGDSFWSYAGSYSDPTTTNVVAGTNVFITDSSWYVYAPPSIKTNSVANGIRSFTASGKLMGQKIANTPVVNQDADWNQFLNDF